MYSQTHNHKASVGEFIDFIYKRQMIWFRRFVMRKPRAEWTKDPILKEHRFCNVFRENDKCTKHVKAAILINPELSLEEKIYNVMLYRRFNSYGFFDKATRPIRLDEWRNSGKIISSLERAKNGGFKLFNCAYISRNVRVSSWRPADKLAQMVYAISDQATARTMRDPSDSAFIQGISIQRTPGFGAFLSYQVLLDLDMILHYHDMQRNVVIGPGALGGAMLLGIKPTLEALSRLRWRVVTRLWGCGTWRIIATSQLENSDIQSCLCEFRKYMCHKLEPGKHRVRYYRSGAENEHIPAVA